MDTLTCKKCGEPCGSIGYCLNCYKTLSWDERYELFLIDNAKEEGRDLANSNTEEQTE